MDTSTPARACMAWASCGKLSPNAPQIAQAVFALFRCVSIKNAVQVTLLSSVMAVRLEWSGTSPVRWWSQKKTSAPSSSTRVRAAVFLAMEMSSAVTRSPAPARPSIRPNSLMSRFTPVTSSASRGSTLRSCSSEKMPSASPLKRSKSAIG